MTEAANIIGRNKKKAQEQIRHAQEEIIEERREVIIVHYDTNDLSVRLLHGV